MIFTTTALGRSVPQVDRLTIHEDRVLKTLFDFRTGPFNPRNEPIRAERLARIAKLKTDDLIKACGRLRSKALIESVSEDMHPAYRITDDGLVFVNNLPQVA
jgi:hypothetical protein